MENEFIGDPIIEERISKLDKAIHENGKNQERKKKNSFFNKVKRFGQGVKNNYNEFEKFRDARQAKSMERQAKELKKLRFQNKLERERMKLEKTRRERYKNTGFNNFNF